MFGQHRRRDTQPQAASAAADLFARYDRKLRRRVRSVVNTSAATPAGRLSGKGILIGSSPYPACRLSESVTPWRSVLTEGKGSAAGEPWPC